MKKLIIIIGIVVLGFLAYTNFSVTSTRRDYIEACLYVSNKDKVKDKCYDVYPENHDRDAMIWGVLSSIGIVILLVAYSNDNIHQSESTQKCVHNNKSPE
ncbi:hypothetical protein [Dehalobacter restrictus]|uniref:hypothetical protein n=1 Tax=Dehalobacter restrictus TaxID=55583 RepID=UPI00338FF223